jgi:hypothetical protein
MKAMVKLVMDLLSVTAKTLKVQLDDSCMVEVGREVLRSGRFHPAHGIDRISHLRREAINAFRTPRLVVRKSTRSRKGVRLSTEHEQKGAGYSWPGK